MHAVLRDIDGGDNLDAVRQGVRKGDGGVGFGFCGPIIEYYVEIAAIYLIDMVLLEESPFCRVEPEVGTPVIDGIALL
jgi:hypothetical protein